MGLSAVILSQVTQEVTKALQGYVTCEDDPVGMVERGFKPRYLGSRTWVLTMLDGQSAESRLNCSES